PFVGDATKATNQGLDYISADGAKAFDDLAGCTFLEHQMSLITAAVVVRRLPDGKLQHQVFVHIVENCSQDTVVVIPIMQHTLTELKKNPNITSAAYCQDNAGCYQSGPMLAACCLMEETTGIKVHRVDFSDPQGGKGACNCKAATIKCHVCRYINEGHDAVNAT
ncbi:Hypothetical predicted protein, partial [Paramuricea clavata]